MKTRTKIVLAIGLAIFLFWLWHALSLPAITEGITEPTTPPAFDSPIAAVSVAPAFTVPELHALYNSDNAEFFNGHLPSDIVIDYNLTNPRFEATTERRDDGRFYIAVNPTYATSSKHVGYLMLHESCHVKLWEQTHKDTDLINPDGTGKDDHGKLWQSCMLGIDAAGGFRRLLIDSYGGK
jgi:hypothetical protein